MKYRDHVNLTTAISLPVIAAFHFSGYDMVNVAAAFWTVQGGSALVDMDLLFVNGKGHRTTSYAHRLNWSLFFLAFSTILFFVFKLQFITVYLNELFGSKIFSFVQTFFMLFMYLCIGWNCHLVGDFLQGGVGWKISGKVKRIGARSFTWDKYDGTWKGSLIHFSLFLLSGLGYWTFHEIISKFYGNAYSPLILAVCFGIHMFFLSRWSSRKITPIWIIFSCLWIYASVSPGVKNFIFEFIPAFQQIKFL